MSQIVVLNAGSQYSHLLARGIRDLGVDVELMPLAVGPERVAGARGIVISGGPDSPQNPEGRRADEAIFRLGVPVLGVCFGHQLLAHVLGGRVERGRWGQYGRAEVRVVQRVGLFKDLNAMESVWMNHVDVVSHVPTGFEVLASTNDGGVAAMGDRRRGLYGVQFHPEVSRTTAGHIILRNFVYDICHCERDWDRDVHDDDMVARIARQANGRNVLFMVSGGVASTVGLALCAKALGPDRVAGLYVDTGLMRAGEGDDVMEIVQTLGVNSLRRVDAAAECFAKLEDVDDGELKRLVIAEEFARIQAVERRRLGRDGARWMLGQGTTYVSVVESGQGVSERVMKGHHNRVGALKTLVDTGDVLEPLADMYRDEVRGLGLRLGLTPRMLRRMPFPGPGLAIRCICASTESGPGEIQSSDNGKLKAVASEHGMEGRMIPLETIGTRGEARFRASVGLVSGPLSQEGLDRISSTAANEIGSIGRLLYVLKPRPVELAQVRVGRRRLTRARVALLREAHRIAEAFAMKHGWVSEDSQWVVALVPIGFRDRDSIVLRPVTTRDGMTAECLKLPGDLLESLGRELEELGGVDMVAYDITSKPPANIEWE